MESKYTLHTPDNYQFSYLGVSAQDVIVDSTD